MHSYYICQRNNLWLKYSSTMNSTHFLFPFNLGVGNTNHRLYLYCQTREKSSRFVYRGSLMWLRTSRSRKEIKVRGENATMESQAGTLLVSQVGTLVHRVLDQAQGGMMAGEPVGRLGKSSRLHLEGRVCCGCSYQKSCTDGSLSQQGAAAEPMVDLVLGRSTACDFLNLTHRQTFTWEFRWESQSLYKLGCANFKFSSWQIVFKCVAMIGKYKVVRRPEMKENGVQIRASCQQLLFGNNLYMCVDTNAHNYIHMHVHKCRGIYTYM